MLRTGQSVVRRVAWIAGLLNGAMESNTDWQERGRAHIVAHRKLRSRATTREA